MWLKDNKEYTEREVRAEYKNTSFPKPFDGTKVGYVYVLPTAKPETTELQIAVRDGVEVIDGNTVQKWKVEDMFSDYTDEEGVLHTKLEQEEAYTLAQFKQTVPKTITMRQTRLALIQAGLLDTINNAVANGTDEVMKVEWEYADEVKRDWDNLNTITTGLGMTERQVDDLFILAGTL